jgi:TRAP-type C4-dicarboxylate transport system permease small subunit
MLRVLFLAAAALVIPLTALLFAQWPLRDWVQAGSREANDLAQILFAIYMAVAVTAATRDGAHLAAGHGSEPSRTPQRWRSWALAACTVPWALFVLWTSAPSLWQSVRQLEKFGETLNPGYFVIRIALALLAALVLAQSVAAVARRPRA